MKILVSACVFFLPLISYASGELFPLKEILVQVFNFSIFALAFGFLMRKPIQAFLHKRQKDFFSFEEQALQLEKEKEKENFIWEEKLKKLKEQEEGIKQKAKMEGEKFAVQKKEELKLLENQLKATGHFLIHLETEKAKKDLIDKWKNKVVQQAGLSLERLSSALDFQHRQFEDFFKQIEKTHTDSV